MTTTTPAPQRIYDTADVTIWSGDAREAMQGLPTASVDALVTDPPYGLSAPPDIDVVLSHWENGDDYHHSAKGFMGRSWDSFVPGPSVWREALRVVKPGAPALVFAGSRTLDLMMASMRLAGWDILGTKHWTYGSSMPKAQDVGKAIADTVGTATPEAAATVEQWRGWKSGLKGAHEPMVLARAPGIARFPIAVSHPYSAKAPGKERVVAYIPTCDCFGDVHAIGNDPDIATFEPSDCPTCSDSFVEYRHNTVKPLAVMRELVRAAPAGGVVLDPFAGSGSTGVAAVEEGRGVILVDASPVHAAMGRERLGGLQPSLFDLFAA